MFRDFNWGETKKKKKIKKKIQKKNSKWPTQKNNVF